MHWGMTCVLRCACAGKQARLPAAVGNRYHCLVRVTGVGPACVTDMCSLASDLGLTDASGVSLLS